MAKISFVLKGSNVDNPMPVLFLYSCSDGRLKYYTGEKAKSLTDPDKGTKAVLRRIESHVENLVIDYKVKGEPLTKEILKASLDALLNKGSKQVASKNMFEAMTAIVDKMEAGIILTPSKKKYSELSIKPLRFTIDLLKRFDPSLTISGTTIDTYHKFVAWMQENDYSTNYIGSQVKNWKTLGKKIGGVIFEDKLFKKITEQTHDIYLTEEEIAAIYELKLVDRFDVVRDWFVLDCYTGLRVSDLVLLNKKNYSGGFIVIANRKTDARVKIPAHRFVKEILNKYNGFPPMVTDVEINKLIKLIAEKAKIKEDVLFTITKGGRRKDEYLKKWQMVSNHSARRSFITNLLKNGVPDSIVMQLAGIKSPLTLKRYNKLGVDEAANIAAKHKFFK